MIRSVDKKSLGAILGSGLKRYESRIFETTQKIINKESYMRN